MSALPNESPHHSSPQRTNLLRAITEYMASLPQAEPIRMTFAEFLDWSNEDTHAEWVNGEVIMPSPASLEHQQIIAFVAETMRLFVQQRQLGVVLLPFVMKLADSAREPDVVFVAEVHRPRIKGTYLDGPADLVVEVISPESVGRDRGDKFFEYEAAGIPEYWLIDPRTQRAEFYRLGADNKYHPVEPHDGVYHAVAIPGFWVRVEWLWLRPDLLTAALEIGGTVLAQVLIEKLREQGYLPMEG